MYAGVPTAIPTDVIPPAVVEADTALAMPKSVTSACPDASRMLSGLMSRWITPARCAFSKADATSLRTRTTSTSGIAPSRWMRACNVSPANSGIV
jgi:hypothetical protein